MAVRTSPLLRFNLAVAAQNSGHLVEALDQYRQFLREDTDPANALRRQQSQAAIAAIEPVLAHVTIGVQGDGNVTEVRLDGRPLPLALLGVEVPVDPTEHIIEAEGTDGRFARETITLGEGEHRVVTLTLRVPESAPSRSRDDETLAPVQRSSPPPRREATAPMSTIERVRRAIEERAQAMDEQGERRWQRTLVLYAFQGTGTPTGLLGLGLRWAARPWFELEFDTGVGHPFGPGVGFSVVGRVPWSYQYATGLALGFGTNFTVIPRGADPMRSCASASPFTPVWFHAGVTNEWRVAPSFTVRVSVGARYLFNSRELRDALDTHCVSRRQDIQFWELFFDDPTVDHDIFPVLPWMMVDLGWVPAL